MKAEKKIGLIDVDSHNYPNLPLMKLSAWHKSRGDIVDWYNPFGDTYDIVYMSKVFSFTPDFTDAINAKKVVKGGSGYAIYIKNEKECYGVDRTLPDKIEHIYPDYSLYPKLTKNTAFGFLTRGCPRGCAFCHVATKEGKRSIKVADLNEFWNGQKNIVLNDPNILACKDWELLLIQLANSGSVVEFNQGLDARLLTKEKVDILKRIKMRKVVFAWDRIEDGPAVMRGLRLYKDATNCNIHHSIVYTLVNFDTTIYQDIQRIYVLRNAGFSAFVMIYNKEHAGPEYKRLARWCNNRILFHSVPRFEDYENQQKIQQNQEQTLF